MCRGGSAAVSVFSLSHSSTTGVSDCCFILFITPFAAAVILDEELRHGETEARRKGGGLFCVYKVVAHVQPY